MYLHIPRDTVARFLKSYPDHPHVDDAIRSRCIAEISYDVPESAEDKAALWSVLSKTYGFNFTPAFVKQLVKEFPNATGRDVKQLCRLVRVKDGAVMTLAPFKVIAQFKPID
jgi:AAA+ superfamily predicted ATPase